MQFEVNITEGNTYSVLRVRSLALTRRDAVHAMTPAPEQKCRTQQHGIWENGQCYIIRKLSTVCIQIKKVNGLWTLAKRTSSDSSYGCDPRARPPQQQSSVHGAGSWFPAAYLTIPPPLNQRTTATCNTFAFLMRSEMDPYLTA